MPPPREHLLGSRRLSALPRAGSAPTRGAARACAAAGLLNTARRGTGRGRTVTLVALAYHYQDRAGSRRWSKRVLDMLSDTLTRQHSLRR